ncbi:hypothetical protein BDV96DRAFT_504698 [Lophiotrema nucula]|uniref:Zn(2)-C6 fungal-type domain-containing protein n=1 Tax=Lophiotrema nucula TaxID=690887 RepID=A0A6A5YQD7_9PLEO|nr:hypothetical protein BDV96DRAFT_504698 [Lophiotrema nucula]
MVGVPKSTGCFICRKRKIKCDETWPTCINCQKNGKCCPGPPARHTFKDLGPKLNLKSTSTSPDENTGIHQQKSKRLTQLNEKWSENGAVFQKFKISSKGFDYFPKQSSSSPRRSPTSSTSPPTLTRQPTPSHCQELSRAMIDALCLGGVGHRMATFGPFIRDVPARVGYSAALDSAVACLVDAHSSMMHKRRANEIVSPGLYLRAVQALQSSLYDRHEGMSSNTLCASVLLGIVEALAGPRTGNQYLAHVGGAGRLMELQGAAKCQDPFAKSILRFSRGGIIITAIYQRKTCFLALPEWREIAFDKTDLTFEDCLYTEVLQRMAEFPALLGELKDLYNQHCEPLTSVLLPEFGKFVNLSLLEDTTQSSPTSDFFESIVSNIYRPMGSYSPNSPSYIDNQATLFNKLQSLRSSLSALGEHLDSNIANQYAATERPAIDRNSPVPTALHFTGWRVAVAYNCFWSLVILTNKTIMKLLPPHDPSLYGLDAECRIIALDICKTWEDAWMSKPIGAFHTGLSFVLAYEFCPPKIQAWILRSMNLLLDHQMVDTFRWTDAVIRRTAERILGERPVVISSGMKRFR